MISYRGKVCIKNILKKKWKWFPGVPQRTLAAAATNRSYNIRTIPLLFNKLGNIYNRRVIIIDQSIEKSIRESIITPKALKIDWTFPSHVRTPTTTLAWNDLDEAISRCRLLDIVRWYQRIKTDVMPFWTSGMYRSITNRCRTVIAHSESGPFLDRRSGVGLR